MALESQIPAVLGTGASNKDKYLHTNSSTGALEWSAVVSGAPIVVMNNFTTVATVTDGS